MGIMRFFRKKSPWLLHFNSGSCLPGDVELIMGDGSIKRIDELVEHYLCGREANPHAFADADGKIVSWNGHSAEVRPLVRVHKLLAPNELLEITTSSGIPVRLTPDHKVLVDGPSGPEWVEAGKLKVGCYLYSPRTISIDESAAPDVIDCLPESYICHITPNKLERIKRELKRTKAAEALGINRSRMNRGTFTIEELKKICRALRISWQDVKREIVKVSGKNFVREIYQMKIDENLMRLLGLIASDGYISVKRDEEHANYKISFSSTERALIDDFIQLYREWSGRDKAAVDTDRRTGVTVVSIYDPILAHVAKQLGFRGVGGEVDLRPIFRLPRTFIAHFLGGYFDGDGHIEVHREGDRERIGIGFTTVSPERAKMVHLLLKRIGIASKVRHAVNKSESGTLYKVLVDDPIDIWRFIQLVPVKHPKKVSRSKTVLKLLNQRKKKQSSLAHVPLECGRLLRAIRKEYGLKQKDIHRWANFISGIENGRRIQKQTLARIIASLEKVVNPADENLQKLRAWASGEYYLDRVRSIKRVPSTERWVYNLTVDGTHSFIPEGSFVVKNCNGCDIEILAALTPRYDIERMGMKLCGSPRHADILVVTGPVTRQARERLLRIYEQMPEPKIVVGVGSCPASGCAFHDCYNVVGPLDKHLPVAAYVPGCPPRPEAIIHGLLKVLEKV